MPGDNVELEVELITPVAMEKGLRFAIREGGRTVGAGTITKSSVGLAVQADAPKGAKPGRRNRLFLSGTLVVLYQGPSSLVPLDHEKQGLESMRALQVPKTHREVPEICRNQVG